mmetsp:Transcript_28072/g.53447  ORF Transcript_28072/g.53447 Transcript_28072/m.53447 type:complete len:252 (-) Transcript_28072:852-1607(-)
MLLSLRMSLSWSRGKRRDPLRRLCAMSRSAASGLSGIAVRNQLRLTSVFFGFVSRAHPESRVRVWMHASTDRRRLGGEGRRGLVAVSVFHSLPRESTLLPLSLLLAKLALHLRIVALPLRVALHGTRLCIHASANTRADRVKCIVVDQGRSAELFTGSTNEVLIHHGNLALIWSVVSKKCTWSEVVNSHMASAKLRAEAWNSTIIETVAAVVAVLVPKPTYRASRVAFVVTIHRSTRSGSVRVTPVRTQTT